MNNIPGYGQGSYPAFGGAGGTFNQREDGGSNNFFDKIEREQSGMSKDEEIQNLRRDNYRL